MSGNPLCEWMTWHSADKFLLRCNLLRRNWGKIWLLAIHFQTSIFIPGLPFLLDRWNNKLFNTCVINVSHNHKVAAHNWSQEDLRSQLAHLVEAQRLALSHHQSSSYLNTRMFPSERSWAVRNCSQPSPSSMPDWCRSSSTRQNLPRGLKIMAFWLLG